MELDLLDHQVPTDGGIRSRATAFDMICAAEIHSYKVVIVENVVEMDDGPPSDRISCVSAALGDLVCVQVGQWHGRRPDRSTTADVRALSAGPLPHWGRKVGAVVLLVIVLAGAVGLLGVRTRTVTRSGHGYTLRVSYPQITRPGLDVAWTRLLRLKTRYPGIS